MFRCCFGSGQDQEDGGGCASSTARGKPDERVVHTCHTGTGGGASDVHP